jgi:hypothetical protein
MTRNPEETSDRERMGWGESLSLVEDLKEVLKREKWRRVRGRPSHARARRDVEPAVVGDSLDLYAILERTKHGIHP